MCRVMMCVMLMVRLIVCLWCVCGVLCLCLWWLMVCYVYGSGPLTTCLCAYVYVIVVYVVCVMLIGHCLIFDHGGAPMCRCFESVGNEPSGHGFDV